MSGECARFSTRDDLMYRLKRRVNGLQQHNQDCHARQLSNQNARAILDYESTAMFMQRVQENKLKKQGKFKTDQMRSKPGDSPLDVRNDHSDFALNTLKRKLESTNGMCNSSLVKPNNLFNGPNSGVSSSGGLQKYLNPQQYDFNNDKGAANHKKMKMDTEPQFLGSSSIQPGLGGNTNCNANNVSSLSVQIVQQFNNEQQQKIETTVNFNTSIDSSNNQEHSDFQSLKENTGKNIKQEMSADNGNHNLQNDNLSNNLNNQTRQIDQQQSENGLEELINDPDLKSWFDELANGENDLTFGLSEDQTLNLLSHPQDQEKSESQGQQSTNFNSNNEHPKDNQFQCKTEKIDLMNFGSGISQEQKLLNTSSNNCHPAMFAARVDSNSKLPCKEDMPFKTEKQSSPFDSQAADQANMQRKMNMLPQQGVNTTNAKLTSQHIQRLSVSVHSQFNISQNQHQTPQASPHQQAVQPQQQMGVQNMNRSTPTQATPDALRQPTPDGQPRMSRTASGMPNSVSPSPVSYSVSHPGHSIQRRMQPNVFPRPISRDGDATTPLGAMNNQNVALARSQMPNQPQQSYQQNYPNSTQRPNWGVNVPRSMTNANMSGVTMSNPGLSKSQQLKELAEKNFTSGGKGVRWNAGSSIAMSSSMTYNGATMTQQQRMSADMQSYSGFQNAAPSMNNFNPQPQANVQTNDLSAASAAAQAALIASQRQHNGAYGTNRLSHYSIEENYANNPSQLMNAKQMYATRGMPTQGQGVKNGFLPRGHAQQMIRSVRPSGDALEGHAMPGFYGRQINPSLPQGRIVNNPMVNDTAGPDMRFHHATTSNNQRMLLVQQQRKMMMEQYELNGGQKPGIGSSTSLRSPMPRSVLSNSQQQMMSQNLPVAVMPTSAPGNGSGNVMFQDNMRSGTNLTMHGMKMQQQNNSMTSWNRVAQGQPQPIINNQSKLPSYNMNMNGNPMPSSSMGSYPMTGGQQRAVMSNRMVMPAGQLQGGNQMQNSIPMARGPVVGQVSTMHPHGVGGYPQPQGMFSSSGMTANNGVVRSQPHQGLTGHNNPTFGQPALNLPNIESKLNLINELIEGE